MIREHQKAYPHADTASFPLPPPLLLHTGVFFCHVKHKIKLLPKRQTVKF